MNIFKPTFFSNNIRQKEFYLGIIVGLGYSFTLNYLFRLATMITNFNYNRKNPIFVSYSNYEFSPFMLNLIGISSVCFGFSYTIYIWLSNLKSKDKKLKNKKRFGQVNSIFIFYVCLLFLIRLFNFFIENPVYLESDFGLYCYCLPIFVFLYNWGLLNRIFKIQKALLIIVPAIFILGKLLSLL
jgi:hypothetical protein